MPSRLRLIVPECGAPGCGVYFAPVGVCVMPLGEISNWSRRTGVGIRAPSEEAANAFATCDQGQAKTCVNRASHSRICRRSLPVAVNGRSSLRPSATWCRFRSGLSSVHCFAHGNLGEHQRTLALDCFQQHFGSDLPLRPLMRRFRQLLNVSPGILRTGSEGRVVRAGSLPYKAYR